MSMKEGRISRRSEGVGSRRVLRWMDGMSCVRVKHHVAFSNRTLTAMWGRQTQPRARHRSVHGGTRRGSPNKITLLLWRRGAEPQTTATPLNLLHYTISQQVSHCEKLVPEVHTHTHTASSSSPLTPFL